MNTTHHTAKTYLVTFAALVALPFALHAGGDSDYERNRAQDSNVARTDVAADHSSIDRSGHSADGQTRTGPMVDRSSRTPNGVAREPNESRAEALDRANQPDATTHRYTGTEHDRQQEPNLNYADRDYIEDRTPATQVDLNRDNAVAMRLNTRTTTRDIESAEFANRDRAINMAESGMSQGKQIVLALRTGTTTDADGRKDIDKAIREVEQAERELNGAITESRGATAARWDNAREELAERYEEYAEALEDAHAVAVDNGMRFRSQVSTGSDLPSDRS